MNNNYRVLSSFTIAALLMAIFLPAAAQANSGWRVQDGNSRELLPLIVDQDLNIQFFLEHINIVKDQNSKLKRICSAGLKDFLVISAKAASLQNGSANRESIQKEMGTFFTKFETDLNEILLPNQVLDVRRLLRQRSLLQQSNCQAFEIIEKNKLRLGMSTAEFTAFCAKSVEIGKKFKEGRGKLLRDGFSKIRPLMPPNFEIDLSQMLEIIAIEEEARLRKETVEFSDLKKWTKIDFDRFEKKCLQDLVYCTMRSERLRERLGISDVQLQQMMEVNRMAVGADTSEYREKALKAAASGDVELAKQIFLDKQQAEAEAAQKAVDEVIETVFNKKQSNQLDAVANLKRQMRESKYGDMFGGCVSWSKLLGASEKNSRKLEDAVKAERKKYYQDLDDLFKASCKETMNALPANGKSQFISSYGEFYDYSGELHARWESLR